MCHTCHTQKLGLYGNKIGDSGVTALANACAGGALPQIKELHLYRNQIGDTGCAALASACVGGAMAQLTVRSLSTPMSSDPETWHVRAFDPDVLFGVPYAGA